ncbi:MAG TPA: DoxX family protein [Cyclobacteriaceae bacterium]|nr:DoxX family protein [Cyclobacteriaceae bacterium]
MKIKTIVSIALRLVASLLMLQTLYFKFTAQPESVYIFSEVGIEPWGRIGTGIAELVAAVLLLAPPTIALGALFAIGIMTGAIATHVFVLGIEVQGDGGQLFAYAFIILVASVILLTMYKQQLLNLKTRLIK